MSGGATGVGRPARHAIRNAQGAVLLILGSVTARSAMSQSASSNTGFVAVGLGYTTPLTSLGTFGSAQAGLGGSPLIALHGGRMLSRRVGVQVGSVVAVRRIIRFEPAANCLGSCNEFSSGQARFAAVGADLILRPFSTRGTVRFFIGPWVRTYRSSKTYSVCDLDQYCANATYFYPTDTRIAGHLGIGLDLGGDTLPVSFDLADFMSSYRTKQTQHNLTITVAVSPRI